MYNKDNITALKLFIKLLLNDYDDRNDNINLTINFCVKYYEYKCDKCLTYGTSTFCSCERKFIQSTKMNVRSNTNVCCKCADIDNLKNSSSYCEVICVTDFYRDEREAFNDLLCLLWLKEKQLHDKLIDKLKLILKHVITIEKKTNILSEDRPIDLNMINITKGKEELTATIFTLANTFTEFISFFDSKEISKYYESYNDIPFNWLVYIIYTLCQNAFKDTMYDSHGFMTMESIVFIDNTIAKSNQIISSSIQNIFKQNTKKLTHR